MTGRRGFTLVELSIVLVIIGLIVGSIVLGQAMIGNAQLRKDLRGIEQYKLAFGAFFMKYQCYPGDCAGSRVGLGTFDGDGNGQISPGAGFNETQINCLGAGNIPVEFTHVNKHLILAGLLDFPDYDATVIQNCREKRANFPLNYGGGLCAYSTLNNSRHVFKTCTAPGSNAVGLTQAPKLTPSIAYQIDSKIDDGKPRAGRVRGGVYQSMISTGVPNYSYPGCVSNASGTYEYLGNSESMDTNANGVEYGCPMVFFDYW